MLIVLALSNNVKVILDCDIASTLASDSPGHKPNQGYI